MLNSGENIPEDKYFRKRADMVEYQLVSRGISSKDVVDVFLRVRRDLFVDEDQRSSAYEDHPVQIGYGQTISQPYMVALMTEYLDLKKTDKVLEIGTGCGYQTAILAELSSEVYSIERIEDLALSAAGRLSKLGYSNIKVKSGDGTLGWEEFAPYDKILVAAGTAKIPEALKKQLAEGGKMVIPVGGTFSQMLILVEKRGGKFISSDVCSCVFVPLIKD